MRRAAIFVVASLLGGLAWAAPPDTFAQKTQVRSAAPTTIDSEASLEYFIAMAGRLVKGDTSQDVAALSARLETLKAQKRALQQSILEKEREIAAKETAAARALIGSLTAQLAKVEVAIRDILAEIERLRDQEQSEQDRIKAAEDALRPVTASLAKAASAHAEVSRATTLSPTSSSTDAFVGKLSAEKKRETADRVRKALAQLSEARRSRLVRLPATPRPTPR